MTVVKMKATEPKKGDKEVTLATEGFQAGTGSSWREAALPAPVSRVARLLATGLGWVVPPALGLLVFVLAWAQISALSGLPGPVSTWASATQAVRGSVLPERSERPGHRLERAARRWRVSASASGWRR